MEQMLAAVLTTKSRFSVLKFPADKYIVQDDFGE